MAATRSPLPGVVVRAGNDGDLAAITDIYNYYVRSTAATFDLEPFTAEERRTWLEQYDVSGPHRLFVATGGQRVLGYATSSRFRAKAAYETSVETTVYCDPAATGHGVGGLLYAELFAALGREDLHRAYAGIALPNEASVRLHRAFGFREVGTYREVGRKHGRYWDVQWFERPLTCP